MGSVSIELECLLWEDPKDSVLEREHEEQIQPLGHANKSPPGVVVLREPTW